MSLIPVFEIGLWNAWIIMVLSLLTAHAFLVPFLDNREAMKRTTQSVPLSKTEKILSLSTHVIIIPATVVYSIFLPLKLSTVWLYVGLPICFLALVIRIITTFNFATTPFDKPVTKGVYRISRYPIYFSQFLLYVGISIACASWVFLLCAVLWIILWHIVLPSEDRFCLKKYVGIYRECMNSTSRWIEVPRSSK